MNDSTDPGSTGEGFPDPTAPSWTTPETAPPTQPIPTGPPVTPPSPYASPAPEPYAPAPWGQIPSDQTAYPQQPYGQTPYGQQPYSQQPNSQTTYGQPPYSMPPGPYGAPPAKNTSAIVLTVVSAITLLSCCNVLAIPSLVLGIIGLNRATTDPHGAARMTKAGWITFGVALALAVIGWMVFFALAAAGGGFDGSQESDFQGL